VCCRWWSCGRAARGGRVHVGGETGEAFGRECREGVRAGGSGGQQGDDWSKPSRVAVGGPAGAQPARAAERWYHRLVWGVDARGMGGGRAGAGRGQAHSRVRHRLEEGPFVMLWGCIVPPACPQASIACECVSNQGGRRHDLAPRYQEAKRRSRRVASAGVGPAAKWND